MSDDSPKPDTPGRRPVRRFLARLVRRTVLLALALLAVAVVLYLAWLPGKLAERIEAELARRLGREVSVGSVTTRLWSPQVTVHQLTVAAAPEAPGDGPLLSIDTMNVSVSPWQALRGGDEIIDDVACRNVTLAMSIDREGRLSIQDILNLQQAPPPSDAPEQPEEPEPQPDQSDRPRRPIFPSRIELSQVEFTLVDARIEGELVTRMPQATVRTWFSEGDTRHHGWSVPGIDVAGRSRDGASTHGRLQFDPQGQLEHAQADLTLQAGDLDLVHQWLDRFAEPDLSTIEATSPRARLSLQYSRDNGTFTVTGSASGTRLETPAGVFDHPQLTLERTGLDGRRGRVALHWQLTVDGARLVEPGAQRIADIGKTRVAASVDVAMDHHPAAGVPLWKQPLVMLEEPIRQLQLNTLEVEGGGAVINGSLLVFDLPRPGHLAGPGGRRHLRDHTWGFARLIVSKHEDALDDWLVELGERALGELPDYGGKTRLVVQANRGRPGRSRDNLTLHAGLATESIDYKGNVLSGNVEGSLDGTWRRGDDHLALAASLSGSRLELIGEDPSDRLVLNSVSNRCDLELQLSGVQLERARLNVKTMVLESDQLVQRVNGQLDEVPLGRLRPTLAALYDTLTHAGRIDLAIETDRLAPGPLLENLTLPGMRQVSGSFRRAVQDAYRQHPTVMEAVRHQLELQSVKADTDAGGQVLGSLGRVLRPSRPMPLQEFVDRFRPVGQLHGNARLSKVPDSTALVLEHDLVLGDLQLEFVGPMQRRLPLHPDGLPWRLHQHLVLDNLVVRPHHIELDLHGRGHLEPTENASTRISWQGRLDTSRGSFALEVEGRNLGEMAETAHEANLPEGRGGFRADLAHTAEGGTQLVATFNDLTARLNGTRLLRLDGQLDLAFGAPEAPGLRLGFDHLVADSSAGPPLQINGAVNLGRLAVGPGRESLVLRAEKMSLSSPGQPGLGIDGRVDLDRRDTVDGSALNLAFNRLAVTTPGRGHPTTVTGGLELGLGRAEGAGVPEARLHFRGLSFADDGDAPLRLDGTVVARPRALLARGLTLETGRGDTHTRVVADIEAHDLVRWVLLEEIVAGQPDEVMLLTGAVLAGQSDRVTRRLIDSVRVGDSPTVTVRLHMPRLDGRPIENLLGTLTTREQAPVNHTLLRLLALRDALQASLPEPTWTHLADVVEHGSADLLQRLRADVRADIDTLVGHAETVENVTLSALVQGGRLRVEQGTIGKGDHVIDLTGSTVSMAGARLDLRRPVATAAKHPLHVFVSLRAQELAATRPMNQYVDFLFPGLSFSGTYSGRSSTTFVVAPDVRQFRDTGRLTMDLARYLGSLNGSGHAIITDGILRGTPKDDPAKPDLDPITGTLPKLDWTSYRFKRMRQDFYVVRGNSHNRMEFTGTTMNLYIHGVSRADFSVRYVVGVDINRNLRGSMPLAGARFPIMKYTGQINRGTFDGNIETVPARLLAYHILKTGLVDSVQEGVLNLGYLEGLARLVTLPVTAVQNIYDWARPTVPAAPPSDGDEAAVE